MNAGASQNEWPGLSTEMREKLIKKGATPTVSVKTGKVLVQFSQRNQIFFHFLGLKNEKFEHGTIGILLLFLPFSGLVSGYWMDIPSLTQRHRQSISKKKAEATLLYKKIEKEFNCKNENLKQLNRKMYDLKKETEKCEKELEETTTKLNKQYELVRSFAEEKEKIDGMLSNKSEHFQPRKWFPL